MKLLQKYNQMNPWIKRGKMEVSDWGREKHQQLDGGAAALLPRIRQL